jgi:hypothetical protein
VSLARNEEPADNETEACEVSKCDANFRCDPILLERVLDKERSGQEEKKPANPGKQFYPQELFPVDCRFRRGWHLRRQDGRQFRRGRYRLRFRGRGLWNR